MENAAKHVEGLSMATNEVAPTIHRLEEEWKKTRVVLDKQEKVLVETYLRFLRRLAKACLERGWRVWFRPNRGQVCSWLITGKRCEELSEAGDRPCNQMLGEPGCVAYRADDDQAVWSDVEPLLFRVG